MLRRIGGITLGLSMAFAPHPVEAVVPASEQVKAIAKRYAEIEEQLPRSVRYLKREENAEGSTVTQAWFDGLGDLLKVATERTSKAGRVLSEFTAPDFQMTYDGLFVLTRKELPAADGGTDVEETRSYYGQASFRDQSGFETMDNGVLIRELRKRAHFAPGELLDTSKTGNTTVVIPKFKASDRTPEKQAETAMFLEEPAKIGAQLQAAGPPESDPFAGTRGDAERFRLIRGSASPDGRYGLAIGFDTAVDWSQYADKEAEEREIYTADGAEDLRNFVIELATNRILGATGGSYFGTRKRYNHRELTMIWSDHSAVFVQQFDSKWSYESCHAGRIGEGPKLIGTVDLGAAVEKHAESFLKGKRRKYEGSIALSVQEVKPDGTMAVRVSGQEASGPNKGEIYFALEETLRLEEKAGKLKLELLKVRLLPND